MTLRERREALTMTQEAVAEIAGLRQSVISALERGTIANPSIDTVEALAPALRLTIGECIAAIRETVQATA